MALARRQMLSNGASDRMPEHAIFLHVQPTSAPTSNGDVAPDASNPSPPECLVSLSGFDQTTGRSAEGTPLSASAPTSRLSDFPCNRSSVFASSATLLLLTQSLVCCIDQLNSRTHSGRSLPPKPATRSPSGAPRAVRLSEGSAIGGALQ